MTYDILEINERLRREPEQAIAAWEAAYGKDEPTRLEVGVGSLALGAGLRAGAYPIAQDAYGLTPATRSWTTRCSRCWGAPTPPTS